MLILGVIEIDEPPSSSSGRDRPMETASGLNEDATLVYIRLVRQESQEAATAIEKIYVAFGSHAALRAAVMITILKMEIQQNHWLPYFDLYTHLFEGCPDAVPLTKYAAVCCLQEWNVAEVELEASGWAELAIAHAPDRGPVRYAGISAYSNCPDI